MANNLTVEYDGDTIHTASATGSATLKTAGKYMEGDVELDYTFDGGAVLPQLIVTGPDTGSTVVASYGQNTVTLTENNSVWVGNIDSYGVWTVTATKGSMNSSCTVNVAEVKQYSVYLSFAHIYGVSWDGTSLTSLTRTDEAEHFVNPSPATAGRPYGSSPFDALYPWSNMHKIEFKLEASSTYESFVIIPKFWYKITQSGNGLSLKIADKKVDGYSVCPACMDRGDGKGERNAIYVGRYHSKDFLYQSLPGTPKTSVSRASARAGVRDKGNGYELMDFATLFTIWMLYLVEYASWDSQGNIGYGCGTGSIVSTGYTDGMKYHTGTNLSLRDTEGCGTQYRNIEGLWDNVYDWLEGCYYDSDGMHIIINPDDFSDSANGVLIGKPSNGFPSILEVCSSPFPMFYPKASSGSNSTYTCDRWSYSATSPVIACGGNYSATKDKGLFCIYCRANGSSGAIGCRLMYLP